MNSHFSYSLMVGPDSVLVATVLLGITVVALFPLMSSAMIQMPNTTYWSALLCSISSMIMVSFFGMLLVIKFARLINSASFLYVSRLDNDPCSSNGDLILLWVLLLKTRLYGGLVIENGLRRTSTRT